MGWLFAVALGLQERRIAAVLRAIVPIALGHVISVTIVVLIAVAASVEFPHAIVQRVSAGVLLSFAVYRLVRARHPRWVGMRVGFWGLLFWGFLMSTAHGAGLMLVPFVTAARSPMSGAPAGWLMIGVHTFGYLLSLSLVALVVYAKVGVSFLRTAWFNVDAAWAAALLVTGIVALFT
ncbi:MAG TPA: hypothetical protein VN909_00200 [Candidatus Dormibacteraeota bacterium]|nr:hypothetical protein [Candidatus Dormibacteraeota bacterium]